MNSYTKEVPDGSIDTTGLDCVRLVADDSPRVSES